METIPGIGEERIGNCWRWCGAVWGSVVWCGAVWCGVGQCGVVWSSVVWCGSSVARYGEVCVWRQYSVMWCGVVR